MDTYQNVFKLCLAVFILSSGVKVNGQTYTNGLTVFNEVLDSSRYNPKLRPLIDQSTAIQVLVTFQLLSIVELDDVRQSLTCNGFLAFAWRDEILKWDKDKYGGQEVIHPVPEDIWRPRVVIMNTLGDRDPFGDDVAPVFLYNTGEASWIPGTLWTTSCQLDISNYPFDRQSCMVQFIAMTLSAEEMVFVAYPSKVSQDFFTENGEWDLVDSSLETSILNTGAANMSAINIKLVMKRRPVTLIWNIIIPVVVISFLNLLVFFIPVESGERIGYGITVLLSLSVYIGIVKSLLPSSSLTTPLLTIYLIILLIIAMMTVIASIFILYTQSLVKLHNEIYPVEFDSADQKKTSNKSAENSGNIYKDIILFVVFFIVWISVTLGFLLYISS